MALKQHFTHLRGNIRAINRLLEGDELGYITSNELKEIRARMVAMLASFDSRCDTFGHDNGKHDGGQKVQSDAG